MGNESSDLSNSTLGHHVLQVLESSVAEEYGIEVFFDYITHINGIYIGQETQVLQDVLRANIGKKTSLSIYSSKYCDTRDVELVLPSELGISVRLCNYSGSESTVWKILKIHPNSPSEKAGLNLNDYLLGTPHAHLETKQDLFDFVQKNVSTQVHFWVYNSETDTIRDIVLIPNNDWGGEGLLGCDIGYGFTHRIQIAHIKNDQIVRRKIHQIINQQIPLPASTPEVIEPVLSELKKEFKSLPSPSRNASRDGSRTPPVRIKVKDILNSPRKQ